MSASYLPTSPRARGQHGEPISQVRMDEAIAMLIATINRIDDFSEDCTIAELRRIMERGESIPPETVSAMLRNIHNDLTSLHYVLTQSRTGKL